MAYGAPSKTRVRGPDSVVCSFRLRAGNLEFNGAALQQLIADRGEIAPKEIAAANDWHPDIVRKAPSKMDELLDREYGSVALRSPYIAKMVYDAVQNPRESVREAVGTFAKAVEAGKRGLDETTSAFVAWAAKHDVNVADERDARMTLRMNRESLAQVQRQLRKGYELWIEGGRDPSEFRNARVKFDDGSAALAGSYLPL